MLKKKNIPSLQGNSTDRNEISRYYRRNTRAHTHAHAHARTHTHAHAHTLAHTQPRTHARTHAYTHTHARGGTHAHARTHAHTRTHEHTRTRTHARTHTHTHARTRTRTHPQAVSSHRNMSLLHSEQVGGSEVHLREVARSDDCLSVLRSNNRHFVSSSQLEPLRRDEHVPQVHLITYLR